VKLRLICIGKLSTPFYKAGVDEYLTRVRRYSNIEVLEIKEGGGVSEKKASAQALEREGEAILRKIPPNAYVAVLDEHGKGISSRKLAVLFENHMLEGTGELIFVIGGPYGLSEKVKNRGNLTLSLSLMTFPHQLVRLLLLEQIYRGFTIIRNEPYHNA
jgi:23S rRNA (pseudouridine1915-N3)-methyltransferase